MTGPQRLPDPVEGRDESCRDVLAWTLDQVGLALAELDRARGPLATALVYGQAWLSRTEDEGGDDA